MDQQTEVLATERLSEGEIRKRHLIIQLEIAKEKYLRAGGDVRLEAAMARRANNPDLAATLDKRAVLFEGFEGGLEEAVKLAKECL